MEINFEISENERKKVIDFLKSENQTDLKNVKEILARYEITILNLKNKIFEYKQDRDDRDIAIKLFFENKLNKQDLLNLTEYAK
jgi:hypothetical protein